MIFYFFFSLFKVLDKPCMKLCGITFIVLNTDFKIINTGPKDFGNLFTHFIICAGAGVAVLLSHADKPWAVPFHTILHIGSVCHCSSTFAPYDSGKRISDLGKCFHPWIVPGFLLGSFKKCFINNAIMLAFINEEFTDFCFRTSFNNFTILYNSGNTARAIVTTIDRTINLSLSSMSLKH